MAKRRVKTLNKTGRIARKDATATATSLREAMVKSGKVERTTKISRKTTATGRAKIAFHVTGKLTNSKRSSTSVRQRSA